MVKVYVFGYHFLWYEMSIYHRLKQITTLKGRVKYGILICNGININGAQKGLTLGMGESSGPGANHADLVPLTSFTSPIHEGIDCSYEFCYYLLFCFLILSL